jgi:tRNA nucleotidyltransferase (CCA-adding enzyme)
MELITTHTNAEFDSFASMVAARRLYPEAVLVFPGAQERNLRLFLEANPQPYRFRRLRGIRLDQVTRLVLVDTRRRDRIGRLADLVGRPGVEVHLFDHHPPSPQDIRGDHEVIAEVGAASTLMTELLIARRLRITPAEATVLGLGIYEDTGSMTFVSTTPRDIRAAAHLLECGMDLQLIADYVSHEMTAEQVSLLDDLLGTCRLVDIGGIGMGVATASRERFVGDLALLAHKVKDIQNLNVLFLLVRMNDRIHLVARSRIEAVDAGRVAAAFGGGGHASAASAVVRETDLEGVSARLLEILGQTVRPLPTARDLMDASVRTVAGGTTLRDAWTLMTRFGLELLPVTGKGGAVLGLVDRRLVERAVGHGLGGESVDGVMVTDFEAVDVGETLPRLEELLLRRGQSFLPVLEGGRLVGGIGRVNLLSDRGDEEREPPVRGESAAVARVSRNLSPLVDERLPPAVAGMIHRIARIAGESGISAFLVGGFVRDLMLGVPNLDVDVVVEGDGIAFAGLLAREFGGRVRSHSRFETAVVILPDGFKIDVATSRMEYYERPGALPAVEHGPIRMDLSRRDFSINAMAMRLSGGEFGRLIDPGGGQRDLGDGVIRVLHGLSFVEDPTRLYRAVRFETRLDFAMSEETLRLVRGAVASNQVDTIVGPRLLGELEEILKEPRAEDPLRRLGELDLLRAVHPSLSWTQIDPALHARLRDEERSSRETGVASATWWILHLAALVRHFSLEEIESLRMRLGMPEPLGALLVGVWMGHRRLLSLPVESQRPSQVRRELMAQPREALIFAVALAPASALAPRVREYLAAGRRPPLLTGGDLMALGYPPGPAFKAMLDELEDARVDGDVPDREAALSWLRRRHPRG